MLWRRNIELARCPLTGDASDPAWNGYLLAVACPCGVTFARWGTPLDAEQELLCFALLN